MLTKIHVVKLNNIWTQRSFNTPYLEYLKNTRFSPVKKKKNMVKSRKVIFRKSQKLLTKRALSELHGGSLFRTFTSYSFNFNSGLRTRRTCFCLLRTPSPRGEQFLWFLKIDLLQFHRIYLLFDWSKFVFNMCFLLRTNLPNFVQIWFMLMLWILVSVTLKKWYWRSVYIYANELSERA